VVGERGRPAPDRLVDVREVVELLYQLGCKLAVQQLAHVAALLHPVEDACALKFGE
jgi:hypothetical protein